MPGFQEVREKLMQEKGFAYFQRIRKGLYIGPQMSAMRLDALRREGITQILKVNEASRSLFPYAKFGIVLKEIPMEDHSDYEIDMA